MTRWTSDRRQRSSKKYRELHAALAKELEEKNILKPQPKPTPSERAMESFSSRYRAYWLNR